MKDSIVGIKFKVMMGSEDREFEIVEKLEGTYYNVKDSKTNDIHKVEFHFPSNFLGIPLIEFKALPISIGGNMYFPFFTERDVKL